MILMDNILNTMGKVQLLYDSGNFVLIEKKAFKMIRLCLVMVGQWTLEIQIRNMKMVFNIYGTWRRITFEKLMMKIYDFFLFG